MSRCWRSCFACLKARGAGRAGMSRGRERSVWRPLETCKAAKPSPPSRCSLFWRGQNVCRGQVEAEGDCQVAFGAGCRPAGRHGAFNVAPVELVVKAGGVVACGGVCGPYPWRSSSASGDRPAELRHGRTSVEGRWPNKLRWGGLRPVSSSRSLLFLRPGEHSPVPARLRAKPSNPEGAA